MKRRKKRSFFCCWGPKFEERLRYQSKNSYKYLFLTMASLPVFAKQKNKNTGQQICSERQKWCSRHEAETAQRNDARKPGAEFSRAMSQLLNAFGTGVQSVHVLPDPTGFMACCQYVFSTQTNISFPKIRNRVQFRASKKIKEGPSMWQGASPLSTIRILKQLQIPNQSWNFFVNKLWVHKIARANKRENANSNYFNKALPLLQRAQIWTSFHHRT